MAANYSDLMPGASLTWKDSGGTKVLSLNGLTSTSNRQGDKSGTLVDGSYGFPEVLQIDLLIQFNTSPTAGNQVNLYLGWSGSATAGSDNSGNLGGADAALTDANQVNQLTFAGSLVAVANNSTNQQVTLMVRPLRQYVMPVIDNQSGVTLKASANVSVVTITPWYRRTPIA